MVLLYNKKIYPNKRDERIIIKRVSLIETEVFLSMGYDLKLLYHVECVKVYSGKRL